MLYEGRLHAGGRISMDPSKPQNAEIEFRQNRWFNVLSIRNPVGNINYVGSTVQVPILPAILPIIILAALPWIRWNFSLRTLLIATTVIAALLGLVVWLKS